MHTTIEEKIKHLPDIRPAYSLNFSDDLSFNSIDISSEHRPYEIAEIRGVNKNKRNIVKICYVAGKTNNANGIGLLLSNELDTDTKTLIDPKNISINCMSDYKTHSKS